MPEAEIRIGDIRDNSGEINIAGGDLYRGFTAEQVSTLLTQIRTTFQPMPFDGRCPYKGLEAFEVQDAGLFFGREKLVEDLVGRVKDSRSLFITGPSGSGKSSLARAGLIHALQEGGLAERHSEGWLYVTLKPGRDPLEALATAFSRLKTPELGEYLRQHVDQAGVLNRCAESALTERKDQRLVLFVDQFEEVFTQVGKEADRRAFLKLLTEAASVEEGRVIILIAMRSDFVSNCATYPQLNALLNQQFVQIGAMQPAELVSAIAQPALRVGLQIDPDLIAQIINDMEGEPGVLPLMQFTLKNLFDTQKSQGGMIALTRGAYLQGGGMHKSLERHADDAFSRLSASDQDLARSIFSSLIEIGRGTQDTRRTALLEELIPANAGAPEVKAVVERLADARLITTDEQAERETVTLAHEKLIDAWPWLRKLVNENRDVISLQNQITEDAEEWDAHRRDASYLYTGGRLMSVREQLSAKRLTLSRTAREFVRSALSKQRRDQRLRILSVSGVSALILAGIVLFSYISTTNANTLAQQSKEFADTQVALAGTSQANADNAMQQARLALARLLVAQAQAYKTKRSPQLMTGVLLGVESMQLLPSSEAGQVLQNNILATPLEAVIQDGAVRCVAFSPDGKYVISGGKDGTARVWEAATGKEVARMTHGGTVWAVSFGPDGKTVVSGGDDKTARVWDAMTGKEIDRMTHGDVVTSVAFSPDGKSVVSASNDKTARVWKATTGKEVARMTHEDVVTAVAFSPDGKSVVSASNDKTARVWDARTGQEIARMTHDGAVNSVAFSPGGKYVVSGSLDRTARVWEAATGKEVARMTHDDRVWTVAFSPDGKYVASGSLDHTARVWKTTSGKETARMTHDDDVNSVAFSPDSRYVVSASKDYTARVWDVVTGQEIARMTHDLRVWSAKFSPDGQYVATISADRTARLWDIFTGRNAISMMHAASVQAVAFSPDGKYVASGGDDNTARVWDATTGIEISRMTHGNVVRAVAFSPDGKYVVSGSGDYTAAGAKDNSVRIWEAATGREIARMSHDDTVRSVGFSPDRKYVVSGSRDRTVRVWDIATGKEIARMTHDGFVYSVAFSPDGKLVASASADSTVRIWEVATRKEVARMKEGDEVNAVAFSPDGKYIVSGNHDHSIQVWEVASLKEVARMSSDDDVNSVAFSPDGKYILSGSLDKSARVWLLATGREVARVNHDGSVNSVAFSPDGRHVLTGSDDNAVRVGLWRPDDLVADACSRVTRNLTQLEWKEYIGDARPYAAICPNLPIEAEMTPTASPTP